MSRTELSSQARGRRGFTLLELMIAAAIGLITIMAAMAMFTGLKQLMEDADRTLVAVSDLQLGTTMVQRDIENAGYHFPSPRTAITIHKNVPTGTIPNGTGNAPNGSVEVISRPAISLAAYTANEGIIEGSDVIEVLTGTQEGFTGVVNGGGILAGSVRDNVSLSEPLGSNLLSIAPQMPVLLFRNKTTECMGEVTAQLSATKFTIQMLDADFQPDAAPPANCPSNGMSIYRLNSRTRYMVYMFDGENRPMLAMQTMDTAAATVGVLSPNVDRLVEGIEDLQVAALMLNTGGLCGAGLGQSCVCDDELGDDCLLDQSTGGNADRMRGVVLELTSRGQRDRKQLGAQLARSMDRDVLPVDDVSRQVFRMAVAAPNLNPSLVATGP